MPISTPVQYVANTVGYGGTTTCSPVFSSPKAGNLLLLVVANKHDEHVPDTPSGWIAPANNQYTGGAGTEGVDDEGTVRVTVFYKIADGTESGSVAVTVPSANVCLGQIWEFTRGGSAWATPVCVGGSDNTAGTSWSVTMGSDPGITVHDLIVCLSATNENVYLHNSANTFTATGATLSNAFRSGQVSGMGNDIGLIGTTHTCTAGTASAAGTYSHTAGGSAANAPAGATIAVRLRATEGIEYVKKGNTAGGTTSAAPTYPTSPTAGNLLLLAVCNKHDEHTPATPSGWTAPANNSYTGGAGTEGNVDEGTVRVTVFTKVSDGTENGAVTVTVTGGNSVTATIYEFSRSGGTGWAAAEIVGGSQNAGGSNAWSVTAGSGISLTANDLVVAVTGINTDATGITGGMSLTASGITAGTPVERDEQVTAQGADCAMQIATLPIVSGTSSAAPVFAATMGGNSTYYPAGATALVRLRVAANAPTITSVNGGSALYPGLNNVPVVGTNLDLVVAVRLVDAEGTEVDVTSTWVLT